MERLTNLQADDQPDHTVFLKDDMLPAGDHHELFETLDSYWNYIAYHLLDHIICEFSITEVRGEMEKYKTDLRTTPLMMLGVTQPRKSIQPPIHFKEIAVSFDWQKDTTLIKVEEFQREYACHYKLHDCAMMLIRLHIASVHVTWIVPTSVVASLKTNPPKALLKRFRVISLRVADTSVYSTNAQYQVSSYSFNALLDLNLHYFSDSSSRNPVRGSRRYSDNSRQG